jgi:hypothetical protein
VGEFPNKATQFPVNRRDHTKKGPRLTTILNKLLSAKWDFNDPKIKELIKKCELEETIEVALCLRRILNGTEGDDAAIERILDRIDGKVAQKNEIEHSGTVNIMPAIKIDDAPMEINIGS